jgi:hypothetical protein
LNPGRLPFANVRAHQRSTMSISEIELLAIVFGRTDFLEGFFRQPLENWGNRKPGGRSGCVGVVCAMRERKGRAGTEDIRQGIEKHRARRNLEKWN